MLDSLQEQPNMICGGGRPMLDSLQEQPNMICGWGRRRLRIGLATRSQPGQAKGALGLPGNRLPERAEPACGNCDQCRRTCR